MNPEISVLVLAAFFGGVLCSLFYTAVIKPVLRDNLRFQLCALRDELRTLAISRKIAPTSFHYFYLEDLLCKLIDRCPWYSWSSLLEFLIKCGKAGLPVEAHRFQAKAPNELKAIWAKALAVMWMVIRVNSPLLSLFYWVLLRMAHGRNNMKTTAKILFQEPLDVFDPAWPRAARI